MQSVKQGPRRSERLSDVVLSLDGSGLSTCELQNRGVEACGVVCCDGLTGAPSRSSGGHVAFASATVLASARPSRQVLQQELCFPSGTAPTIKKPPTVAEGFVMVGETGFEPGRRAERPSAPKAMTVMICPAIS
ncbi:MAG: hypothetical protein H6739_29300 [Alphaproteobacteria bacterium]|nr:hypothetical protein [Alphaproteobacteria bacterium]